MQEAFGIPLVEAMACQVPVIASRSGGMPEVIDDGNTGLIVEREDAAGLAEALARLLADDTLRAEMAVAAHIRAVQRFSWDSAAHQLQAYYEDLYVPEPVRTEARHAWATE